MSGSDYFLQNFGISAYSLQEGVSDQIIRAASIEIAQIQETGNKACLIDIANKLLPFIEDSKFSPIWVILLDRLSALHEHEAVQAVYSLINEKQAGSLPAEIVHKLWLTHLPSLEMAVLMLVKQMCLGHDFPDLTATHDALARSHLVVLASRETIIYNTVYRMLHSVTVENNFASALVEITAEFCHVVRMVTAKAACHSQVRITLTPAGDNQIERVLRSYPDPDDMPSCSVLSTVHNMHKLWTDNENKVSGEAGELPSDQSSHLHTSSFRAVDRRFEDLWCITLQYRRWIFAALKNVLSCDQQYVESCLWFIAAHHRINLYLGEFKVFLLNFVNGLRDFLHAPCKYSELVSLITTAGKGTCLDMESKASHIRATEETNHSAITINRSIVNHLLMAYLFISHAGFTIGKEIVAFVTSSGDICDQIRCLSYFFQVLNITSSQRSLLTFSQVQSFVSELTRQLEHENKTRGITDFLNLQDRLKALLTN